MVYLCCSSCKNVLVNCRHQYINNHTIASVSCGDCYNDGRYKETIKKDLKLIESAFFMFDQAVTLRNIVNQSTYQFTKKFDQFKINIVKDEPQLSKQIDEMVARLLNTMEDFVKKEIIKESKYLTRLIKAEALGIEKLKLDVKQTRDNTRNKLMISGIWTTPEINEHMTLFDKKINRYNEKMQIYDRLNQQGQRITCQQSLNMLRQSSVQSSILNKITITTGQQLEQ